MSTSTPSPGIPMPPRSQEDRIREVIAEAIDRWPAGRISAQSNEVFHAIRDVFQKYPEMRGVFLTCSECRRPMPDCPEEWVRNGVCSRTCWGHLHMEAA